MEECAKCDLGGSSRFLPQPHHALPVISLLADPIKYNISLFLEDAWDSPLPGSPSCSFLHLAGPTPTLAVRVPSLLPVRILSLLQSPACPAPPKLHIASPFHAPGVSGDHGGRARQAGLHPAPCGPGCMTLGQSFPLSLVFPRPDSQ